MSSGVAHMNAFDFADDHEDYEEPRKSNRVSSVGRPLYMLLAILLGWPIPVHNIVARKYGTAAIQFLLTLSVIGNVVSIPWVLWNIFFTTTDGEGKRMK